MTLTELNKATGNGTYAGVTFSKKTLQEVKKYGKENQIPNLLSSSKTHSTLLYSRKHCPNYKPAGEINPAWIGTPTHLEVWPSQPDDNGNSVNCLVLRYKCSELESRHKTLMDTHNATFDFDSYNPHITISYDVGDLDLDSLTDIKTNLKTIEIINEYGESLNLSWANEKT